MFHIDHVAISVTNMEKSIEFYSKFRFEEFHSWKADDDSIKNRNRFTGIRNKTFCIKGGGY